MALNRRDRSEFGAIGVLGWYWLEQVESAQLEPGKFYLPITFSLIRENAMIGKSPLESATFVWHAHCCLVASAGPERQLGQKI